ncbi:MAG: YbbR-like domain-containing protein [Prevotella sp.]|nr:YbbR-like domain-containing protein [Prevotella sp.]
MLTFLLFFALAGVFWLMTTLNEVYEQEMRIAVRYTRIPQNVVLTSSETDTLRVTVSDKGFNIISFVYGQVQRPLNIEFKRYADGRGTGTVGTTDLRKMAISALPASAKLVAVKPEKLKFYYNYGESKKVPVKFTGKVTPQQLYYIAETKYSPDSVTIYATKRMLDTITVAYTEELHYSDLHDTLKVLAAIQPIVGAKTVPEHVNISFITDVLTEVEINDIPIEGINMPQGKKLRTFPAKVTVKCVTGMKNFQSITADDFQVVANYNEFSQSTSSKCGIWIRRVPQGVSNAKLKVKEVDYLIENTAK